MSSHRIIEFTFSYSIIARLICVDIFVFANTTYAITISFRRR